MLLKQKAKPNQANKKACAALTKGLYSKVYASWKSVKNQIVLSTQKGNTFSYVPIKLRNQFGNHTVY